MPFLRSFILIVMLTSIGSVWIGAQDMGSIEISAKIKIDDKSVNLKRKRFYLFKGGNEQNQKLITSLHDIVITSRDCFYSKIPASPQYICWLQAENCESPYCRKITADEVDRVPEFQAAYKKGLTQFKGLQSIALDWITTNMPPVLTSGFYRERRGIAKDLLKGIEILQSSMTDTNGFRVTFIDIPIALQPGKQTETFFITNILPFEIGNKSYVFACPIDIDPAKNSSPQKYVFPSITSVPGITKPGKKCEVIVKELEVCKTQSCPVK